MGGMFVTRRKHIGMIVDNLAVNGISTVVVNISNILSEQENNVTIVCGGHIDDSVIGKMKHSVTVVSLPSRKGNTIAYYRALRRHLEVASYNVIHIHCNSATVIPEIAIAKLLANIQVACHCHNVTCNYPRFHKVFSGLVSKCCDYRYACSEGAGIWMYGKKRFRIIPNCFETSAFIFSLDAREKVRASLGIEKDEFLFGHAGVFNYQKNHSFLLDVFARLKMQIPKSKLILLGSGSMKELIAKKSCDLGIADSVIFHDPVPNVADFYSAMDVFLFPSHFEGLSLSIVEAQLSGMPCFASDALSSEASVSDLLFKIPLAVGSDGWAKRIIATSGEYPSVKGRFIGVRPDLDFDRFDLKRLRHAVKHLYEPSSDVEGDVLDG